MKLGGAYLLCVAFQVQAQVAPVVMTIEVENSVMYFDETGDPRTYSALPERRTLSSDPQYTRMIQMTDIVSINGKPARGLRVQTGMQTVYRPDAATNLQAVADVSRTSVVETHYEILAPDGTFVGQIMTLGHNAGPAPPGVTSAGNPSGSWAIVGGTGAFVGVYGQTTFYPGAVPARVAPMSESGQMRRANGGGQAKYILYLYPRARPEVVSVNGIPTVYHADFTPVTASNPARAGESVILKAANLGPTKTFLPPGEPFPSDAIHEVNSPVEVTVNGMEVRSFLRISGPPSRTSIPVAD